MPDSFVRVVGSSGAFLQFPPIYTSRGVRKRRPVRWRRGGLPGKMFLWQFDSVTGVLYLHKNSIKEWEQRAR